MAKKPQKTKPQKTKKPQTKASRKRRKIQVWTKEVLQAARAALEYTINDVGKKSGVDDKVVGRIMQGYYKVRYESLEAVVSSLFLEMPEIYNPEAKIARVIKEIYIREAKASIRPREIQVWTKEVLQAARAALEYTINDVGKKSGVDDKVVGWIMRGQCKVRYESLEAVVSSLFLEMPEIYNPEAKIARVIKEIYNRANLKYEVRKVNGGVVAVKPNGKLIVISGK